MIRNDFPDEILLYQNSISIPFSVFPALVYHFTTTYLNQPRKKSTIAIYVYCFLGFVLNITGAIRNYSEYSLLAFFIRSSPSVIVESMPFNQPTVFHRE